MKLLFTPFSILAGLIAGFISKKVFDQAWGLIDREEPPEGKHRDIRWGKLIAAAALLGAGAFIESITVEILLAVIAGSSASGGRALAGPCGSASTVLMVSGALLQPARARRAALAAAAR